MNPIEEETFYDFHIHQATERYQQIGAKEDTYETLLRNTLSVFNVQDRKEELFVPIQNHSYGDAFYRFVQAILRIEAVLGVA